MREAGTSGANDRDGDLLAQIAHSLHEMCQPLTVLQCRLEIDLMESEQGPSLTRMSAECLQDCERLNARVHAMRALVQRAMAAERRGRA